MYLISTRDVHEKYQVRERKFECGLQKKNSSYENAECGRMARIKEIADAADAGLVLFQKLRFKLTFPVTGNRNLDFTETGPQMRPSR